MDPDIGFTLYAFVFVLFVGWALGGRWLVARSRLRASWVVVVSVALPLIIAVAYWDTSNTDIDNLLYTASILRAGGDVYEAPWRTFYPFHPYLPLHMYVLYVADIVADFTPLPFALLLKLPAIAAAAGITQLVYRTAKQSLTDDNAVWLAGFVALNPILIWAVAIHGQFDAIATFLLLAAVCVQFPAPSQRPVEASALLFGLGILYKLWPLLAAPTLLALIPKSAGRVRFVLLATATVAAGIAAYALMVWTSPGDVVRTVGDYRGVPGLTGYSRILFDLAGSEAEEGERLRFLLDHGTTILLVALAPIFLLGLAAKSPFYSIATVILGFYVFASAGATHYYVWIIPFALLAGQHGWLTWFSVIAGAFAGSGSFFSAVDEETSANIVNALLWIYAVAWLGWNIGAIVNERFGPEPQPAGAVSG